VRGGNDDHQHVCAANMPEGARRWPRWHRVRGVIDLLPRVRRARA
jgi:hypothetical protein